MMLSDWMYWLSSIPPDELLLLVGVAFLSDGIRYFLMPVLMWLYDAAVNSARYLIGTPDRQSIQRYTPSVSLIIAGLNEGDSLEKTLNLIWGSYPLLQIIVVDDGSSDNMAEVARGFSATHDNVLVISRRRGGKSSAMNAGLALATGEVTVILDADSELSTDAIWRIVQPLANPAVGAVSGNVRVRNRSCNLLTRLQAYEYLRSIFLGRMVSSRLGILGIVSGAFGAFRTSMLKKMGGWDVGPGEDEELVLRIRKMGYRIEFVPYAECLTESPTSMKVLTKQRRRWEWAVVTFESRKHIDMAQPWNKHFRWSNMILFLERWFFNLVLPICFWVYLATWFYMVGIQQCLQMSAIFYLLYVVGDILLYLVILYYSPNRSADYKSLFVIPAMPLYQLYQRGITTIAILEEMITRRSYRDGFVPEHVRNATWHW